MHRSKILVRTLFVIILLAGLIAGFFLPFLVSVQAAPQRQDVCGLTLTKWTFDPTPSSTTNPAPSSGNGTSSENGVGGIGYQTTGAHTGNAWVGSAWPTTTTPSTFFEFDVSSVGYTDIQMSFWDSRSITSGPTTVSVQYSSDGTAFTQFNTYSVTGTATPTQTSIDLSSITGLENDSSAKFRIYGINAGSSAGTLRIDDVTFTGCQLTAVELTGTASGLTATASAATPTPTPTATLTSTPTFAPTNTSTPTSTGTSTFTPTATNTSIPTKTPTFISTNTPTSTSTAFPARSLVINEVGWMGTKADSSDEWIELYNPGSSAVNLSGWVLSRASSSNINLAGTIPSSGFFLILDNSNVFQNLASFSPYYQISGLSLSNNGQALTLLDPTSATVDTADSWGGAWPAGMASSSNSNLAYSSMERIGGVPDSPTAWVTYAGPTTTIPDRGGNSVHGTPGKANWASTVTETPSPTATTTSSVCPSTFSYHSLLINEVGWMGTAASSSDEWIEIHNPGTACINLSAGWVLKIADSGININLAGTINPGGYFILADNGSVFQNVTINQSTTSLSLLNDGEALYLIGPDGYTQVDSANWWDGNWPAGIASSSNSTLAYSSMERIGAVADSPSAWVTFAGPATSTPLDRNGNHVHGTPGMANWAWTVTETPSVIPTGTHKPTPTYAPTPVPAVVINEILARPGSDWNGDGAVNNSDEFIEVENLGPGIATLSNWRLSVTPNNGTSSFYLPTLKLNPNERKVFFGSTTHFLLEDSGDTVSLIDTHGVVEDAFTYPAVIQPDDSWCRIRDGIGFWRDGCFPTPGFENALSGLLPSLLTPQPGREAACLLPDVAPDAFRLAECNGPGADIWNQQYWNDLSGQNEYAVPDPNNKGKTYIQ